MGVTSCDRVKVLSGWQLGRLVNSQGFRIRHYQGSSLHGLGQVI